VNGRRSLRWRILGLVSLSLVGLTFTMLWLVHRRVSTQVNRNIREDLKRSSAVFENMLAARAERLEEASQVIVRDPRFFSVLTLPGSSTDKQLRATVAGVAADFNRITHSDLFEVLAADGHLLASVGRESSSEKRRAPLVHQALLGRPVSSLLIEPRTHYQVSITPIQVGGRIVGALLLGAGFGEPLAQRLKSLTRSEITFMAQDTPTGSTLETSEDRDALYRALHDLAAHPEPDRAFGAVIEIQGQSQTWMTLVHALPGSDPSRQQWYVMQRSLDAESAFLHEIQSQLVAVALIAVFVALLAGWFLSERMTSPVQRLVRAAEEMERGHYDYPLDVRSRDEIGYLAARFSDMRARQRAYVTSLQEVARLKSEFISVASHELRTPISVIKGYQDLFAIGALGTLTPDQQEAIAAITRSVTMLERIAEDATRMAHVEGARLELEIERCSLRTLVERAVADVRTAAIGRRVELETRVSPNDARVDVDGLRVSQALANLISNGIRFTPDGGRVRVDASVRDGQLTIAVEDSGIGIPPDKRERLFDRAFVATESKNHHSSNVLAYNSAGLGLGLAIARGIVEAHGGTLSVDSEVGRGSVFMIWMPAEVAVKREEAA
jgi:signal transduction histidine kinase